MLFQILDDKQSCVGVYLENGELVFDDLPPGLSKTWKYSQFLKDYNNIQYALLYASGKKLSEVCPENLKEQWLSVSQQLKAYYKAFTTAKVCLKENCFFDLVPESFLLNFCETKNKITTHVLENYPKPNDYEFLAELQKLLLDIKHQKLNINKGNLLSSAHEPRARSFLSSNHKPYILYNIFGGKTGRLTTLPGSFPIFNLDKAHRKVIEPTNDYFLEMDYNAAEIRVFLSLLGLKQPAKDIHQWNLDNIPNMGNTRQEAKDSFFAWFYNPYATNESLEQVYDKNTLVNKYWDGQHVNTTYKKKIPSDRWHAFNYLIQSTTASMVLRQVLKVYKSLQGKESFVSHMVHDNVVIDMKAEETYLIDDLKALFSKTRFGDFKIQTSTGLNMGEMDVQS